MKLRRFGPKYLARMISSTALASVLSVGLMATSGAAQSLKNLRTAIVVGNQDYDIISDLNNARRDAEGMAAMLEEFGFTVYAGYDLDRRGFEELVRTAMLNMPNGADVVFYYSGHGIQIGRRNYLLPTDAAFESVYDLPVESITLDRVMDALAARGATHVSIVDSCRENPFPDTMMAGNLDATLFETRAGFDVLKTPINSFVSFSTSPGETALDGPDGGHSPYTEAVLHTMSTADDDNIQSLFSEVRRRVYDATGGTQVPWESSTLVRPFKIRGLTLASTSTSESGEVEVAETAETETVTAEAETETATETTAETETAVAEGETRAGGVLPDAVELVAELDRGVSLDDQLAQALGRAPIDPRITRAPRLGRLSVDDANTGGVVYRPFLSETRATDLQNPTHEDTFEVELGPSDARKTVEVSLVLTPGACDLAAGDALDLEGVGYFRLPNEIVIDDALAACTAALAEAPDKPRFHYQLGRAQQAAGQFEEAYASFQRALEGGHTRALNATAFLLFTIRINRDLVDIPMDLELANTLLDQGIAKGDPFAMHARGLRLLRNGETPEEKERGFELLDRAVEFGHTYSMNELGVYFLVEDNGNYQPDRGLRYLEASSARGDIFGHHNLGFNALRGLDGSEPDFERAQGYFERAAAGGHPFSPATLGRMIMRGQLGNPDAGKALEWYDLGLERGDGWGGTNGAVLIMNGQVSGFSQADAALRAAKTMHLASDGAKETAEQILAAVPAREINRGLQQLLVDLGEDIAVDGAVGPGTLAALGRVLDRNDLPAPPSGPKDRLLAAAKAYWAERPTRPDLF